ncbi:MAG: HisA/HisF-related TIM barrel protein [Actinomycetota bacterium]|nr:HisA/HisF-related TIM barrel protein [Actinomycetota bacterium]
MELYARVNILDGRAVRLPHGTLDEVIYLDADPVARSLGWIAQGADRLHIVDLDAAIKDDFRNRPLIREIIAEVDVPVQVGGGVRSNLEVDRLLDAGAWRVVMGTVAITDQVLFWEICRSHPGRIAVSLDITEDQELVTQGWQHGSGRYLEETLIELASAGAAAFLLSEVGRDALEEPPNYEALETAISIVDEEVIAAGGVRDLDDVRGLLKIASGDKRLAGLIIGREVTSGRFTVEDAQALLTGATKDLGPWSLEQLEEEAATYLQVLTDGGDRDAAMTMEHVASFLRWLGGGTP